MIHFPLLLTLSKTIWLGSDFSQPGHMGCRCRVAFTVLSRAFGTGMDDWRTGPWRRPPEEPPEWPAEPSVACSEVVESSRGCWLSAAAVLDGGGAGCSCGAGWAAGTSGEGDDDDDVAKMAASPPPPPLCWLPRGSNFSDLWLSLVEMMRFPSLSRFVSPESVGVGGCRRARALVVRPSCAKTKTVNIKAK